MVESFFEEQSEQSQIKSAIVSKYFWSWAKVITGHQKRRNEQPKISYIDLFAGPGRYKDNTKSTPLLILEQAIREPIFSRALVTLFNDKNPGSSSSLKKEVAALSGIENLKFPPEIRCEEVGENVVKMFEKMNHIPTLMFVDPWGYKGLSLRLVNSVLKDWACECIFFFNYNRINMGLNNDFVKDHIEALFGANQAPPLRKKLEHLRPEKRELAIVEELCQALKKMGGEFVLPFCFRNAEGNRTSHHLVFVSKHKLGYKIMKNVMAAESTSAQQGVASFEYNPADKNDQPLLFELTRPLDDLEDMLLDTFAGRTMTMVQIYDAHNVGLRYTDTNYKDVLKKMELDGKISADPPHKARRKVKGQVTFADTVKVTFPAKHKGKT
jgi:three-Cys-motif partner protein